MGSVASDELLDPIKGWIRRRSKTEPLGCGPERKKLEHAPRAVPGGWNTLHFTNVFVRVRQV